MPVEGGSSSGSASAARHPKQKRKAHSLSIRRTNSTEDRPWASKEETCWRDSNVLTCGADRANGQVAHVTVTDCWFLSACQKKE
ncbi:hypothetical protein INR49_021100 [Caranx melampygus]|nr:hypothetical protein INR49_021100 [Caranx melampygus]